MSNDLLKINKLLGLDNDENNISNNIKITKEILDITNENFDCDIYYIEYQNFDWEQYVNNYIDLRDSDINTMEKAWNHWITFGVDEKRTYKKIHNEDYDSFDWIQYLKNYPELFENGIKTKDDAWFHWFHNGLYEGRTYSNLLVEKLKNK